MSVFEPLGETSSRDGLESNEDVVNMRMLAVMLLLDGARLYCLGLMFVHRLSIGGGMASSAKLWNVVVTTVRLSAR